MDSTLLQFSFQACPLIVNHVSHFYYTRIISQSNGLNTPLVLILGLSTISQSYFLLFTIRVSSHRAMDSTLLQCSFQVCPLFLNHISHFYYTRIISHSNRLNTPLVLILGLSTNFRSYFPLLLYAYHLTEQWTQHSSSTHSRSVHYFLIMFPTFTIRVSSHTARDSTLLWYSFQVCPLSLNHISHFYYTRIISQSNGLNTPLVLILGLSTNCQSYFPLFFIRVSSHRAMDSTLLQYSFQVCPLFLNHISYSLLYAYHLTEQWTQHSSSTHSRLSTIS